MYVYDIFIMYCMAHCTTEVECISTVVQYYHIVCPNCHTIISSHVRFVLVMVVESAGSLMIMTIILASYAILFTRGYQQHGGPE